MNITLVFVGENSVFEGEMQVNWNEFTTENTEIKKKHLDEEKNRKFFNLVHKYEIAFCEK